ncbi:MAG: PLDc N-terminal domain-containing protein [Actinobacteria bacterium]|nr:PLDc N-terminal domain-containing protein [Actinomycetota bacterium]
MIRFLIPVLLVGFMIYTLVDCARTDESQVRNLPKWAWIAIIIIIQTLGAIAYWVAGRPKRPGRGSGPKRRILPPDDDPDFLRKL